MDEVNADNEIIAIAEFNRSVIFYWYIMTNLFLLVTIIGIVVMLFWVPFGWIIHKKQLENASCNLTKRGIAIRKGWIFKAQQNIPLDKLTDISIHEGPVLNLFGIVRISIETAGATPFQLIGLKKSSTPLFRDIVMKQRDSQTSTASTSSQEGQSGDVLVEIRDILHQINMNLSKRE
jgi:membrane protein YdbS with pleckstrin-like domain